MMGSLFSGLGYGLRALRRSPAFAAAAIAALALGIGANTAIFSVANAVLLRPPPYRDPDRLVWIWERSPEAGLDKFSVAPPKLRDWQSQARSFQGLAALRDWSANLVGPAGPRRVQGLRVSAALFPLLGVAPVAGRGFSPDDDRPGAPPVVLLSHRLWQEDFGGDPRVAGRQIRLNGESFTVVGVLGPEVAFPSREVDLWAPLALPPEELRERAFHSLRVVARLAPGTTGERAQREMDLLSRRFARDYPDSDAGWSTRLVSFRDEATGDLRRPLALLLATAAFFLLIACTDVANLLLARAAARGREIALRAALGAGRGRLVGQLLGESLVLALAGCLAGLALAFAGLRALSAAVPARYLALRGVGLDPRVLLFTLLLSLATGLLCGLLPALHASRADLNALLRQGGRGAMGGASRRAQRLLVGAETLFAFVLVAGAGLLLKSFWRLESTPPGFRPERVLTLELALPESDYPGPGRVRFYDRLLARVRALPGVSAAALVRPLPLSGSDPLLAFTVEGRPSRAGEEPTARYRAVSPGYFRTLGIPLLAGRDLAADDDGAAPGVIVVNRTLARQLAPGTPGEAPRAVLGLRLRPLFPGNRPCTVVGVSGDVRHVGLGDEPRPEMYVPYPQVPAGMSAMVIGTMFLAVRTAGDPAALAGAARRAVRELDPALPVFDVQTMEERLAGSLAERRFVLRLLALFAGLGVVLAGIGLYGVLAYFTSRRTPEIGLRMALGAGRWPVLRLVLSEGLGIAGAGLLAGWLAALAAAPALAALLHRVSPRDPAVFLGAALLLLAAALLAVALPAWRALRVDPAVGLRHE